MNPPDSSITSGPQGKTKDRTPKFRFSASEENSTFKCSLDGARFKPCDSPYTTRRLSFGKHKFEVVATDSASNKDRSPAKRGFEVVR